MACVVMKAYLEMPDLSVETRRFGVEKTMIARDGIYGQIHGKVGNIFPALNDKNFVLYWKDEDEDFVTMSTDDEIRGLLSDESNGSCKIYIRVRENAEEQTMATGQDSGKEMSNKQEQPDDSISQYGIPSAMFPPPPPPPPFLSQGGLSWGFHPPHHGHGFGHHFPHYGMHHGKHFGMHYGPHHGPHPHMAVGHHPYGHHHWGHRWGMHKGNHGFKDALRSMVPLPYRRWAKGYIRSWRAQHLKNTTTTTDSDGGCNLKHSTAEAGGVPKEYADWLDIKLPRWHKKWSSDEVGDFEIDDKANKVERKTIKALKASVPIEFRKWTKQYLNTHFLRRDAPKFRKHNHGCGWDGEMANKRAFFFATVPRGLRMWTKKFIRNWRIEKKLDAPNVTIPSSSDTDDCKSDVDDNSVFVDPEYKPWLEKFLLRWHTWRGQLERSPDMRMRCGMGCFKGTIPMEYRAWVKFYMARRYGKHDKKTENHCSEVKGDPTQKKYEDMLQAFQKKWMENQKDSGSDSDNMVFMSSGSEEEANKGEPETSFDRLSISDNGCKKSKVRFDDQFETQAKKQKILKKTEDGFLLLDSDDDGDEDKDTMPKRKETMNPNFRRWAKHALYSWDGKTVGKANGAQQDADGETTLPPNVYNWMSKMMMKMQMKKMKQELKAAKREMKASKKQQKHENN